MSTLLFKLFIWAFVIPYMAFQIGRWYENNLWMERVNNAMQELSEGVNTTLTPNSFLNDVEPVPTFTN